MISLPVDVIANTRPPRFRWKYQHVECQGTVVPSLEGPLSELVALARALEAERDKLQAFKSWVHDYLDKHGVPTGPGGPHSAEGCRIGDRMDWVFEQLANSKPAPEAKAPQGKRK